MFISGVPEFLALPCVVVVVVAVCLFVCLCVCFYGRNATVTSKYGSKACSFSLWYLCASRVFHGILSGIGHGIPWKMFSIEFYEKYSFHGIPWNSME